ncbi:MAG: serine/threonine protein kinase [Planctomycetes bacterium]|nr:serine/threonine protein kinase [Planctomycetota bacterium]
MAVAVREAAPKRSEAPVEADRPTGAPGLLGGRYRVRAPLQRGGQGQLYLAFDERLGREVVVKTLACRLAAFDPRARERLRREARLAGMLQDPHLCPVLDLIEDEADVYVVMPFIQGEDLRSRIRRFASDGPRTSATASLWSSLIRGPAETAGVGTEPPQEAQTHPADPHAAAQHGTTGDLRPVVYLLERIARAVHIAHLAGIVHRDLKPQNIMVRPNGDPVVLDFGLALDTRTADPARLTQDGAALGTPPYMAPEQVEGSRGVIDPRTDIYALGVMLYELLTLRLPFQADSQARLFERILVGDPTPPRKLNPTIPRDLQSVCLRAMHRERSRRYASALDLADDLRRVRLLQPTIARPVSTMERTWRSLRRRPGTLAASLLIVLAATSGIVILAQQRANQEIRQRFFDLDRKLRAAVTALEAKGIALPEDFATIEKQRPEMRSPASLQTAQWLPANRVRSQDLFFVVTRRPTWIEYGDLVLVVESLDGQRTEELPMLEAVHGGRWTAQWPAERTLAPGAYHWWVQRAKDSRSEVTPDQMVGFTVVDGHENANAERLLALIPTDLDEPSTRLLRAVVFHDIELHTAAIRELEDRIPPTRTGASALWELVLAAAHAGVDNWQRFTEIRERALGR